MDNNNKARQFRVFLALSFVIFGGAGGAVAAEVGAKFRIGYTTSDNIFLQPDVEIDDSIWSAGLTLNFHEETSRTLIDIRAIADYLNYFDTFDSETVAAVDASFDYELVEDRLSWRIQDNFGQRLTDPLGTPNPGNRENINYFSTGPRVDLPMGDRYFLGLEGSVSTVRYEDSVNENDRTAGLFQLARRADSNAVTSLNFATEKVKYSTGTSANDFRVNEAFVAYEAESDRNNIFLNLGYTEVETTGDSASGYLVRAQWTRFTSESTTLLVNIGSEYSTEGDVFRLSQSNNRPIGATVDAVTDDVPFQNHFLFSRFSVNGERTKLSIEVSWNQEDFEYPAQTPVAFDRDILHGSLGIEREFTRKLFAGLDLRFRTRDYKYINLDDDNMRVIATFGFRFSNSLDMFLRLQHQERDSSDPTESFTENRATIGFEYTPPWGR